MKKILTILFFASLMSCVPSAEEEAAWNNAVTRAKQVQQFDTIESVLEVMQDRPTSKEVRGLTSIDPNGDTQTFLVWEYGKGKRIFMGFYNDLSTEVKIRDYTFYRANLYDNKRDPRYNKK